MLVIPKCRRPQHIERIVDLTVVTQRQAPTIQTLQKMVEVPDSQHLVSSGRLAFGGAATNSNDPEGGKDGRDPPDAVH